MQHYRMLFVALTASLVLGACGWDGQPPETNNPDAASAPEAGEPVTISFLAQEWERSRYQPLIDRFNEENPDVQVQYIAREEVDGAEFDISISPEQRMRRVVEAADTAAAYAIGPEYVTNDYLFDLAPLMDADPTFARDDFYPGVLESVSQDGGVYMLPSSMYVSLLSYNQELWAAAGLPEPDPNWSWNDMIGAAEQLAQTRSSADDVYGYAGSGSGLTAFMVEAAQAGIDLAATPTEELDLQQPELIAALERVAALAESGAILVHTEAEDGAPSMEEQQRMVLAGQVGIWNADLLFWGAEDEEPQFEIGTAPFPVMTNRSFGSTQGYIMSSGTQYPQQAWRWLEFLSRQELEDDFDPGQIPSELPARVSVADTSGYWTALDDETAAAVRAMLERSAEPMLQQRISFVNLFEPISEALQGVVQGDQTAEAALRDAQASLDEQLAEAQQSTEATPETGPIVVATPIAEVVADGATQISFGISQFRAGNLRPVVREFNQNSPDVFVELNEIDTSEGPVELRDVTNTSDCFTWWGLPPEEITTTLDLQPLIDADASFDINDYPPVLLESFQHEAGLYGLPYTVNFQTLTYNQTAFDTAGLDYPAIDWTLDDFLNAAQQLTTGEGNNQQYGYISMGGQTSEIFFFLRRAGADLMQGSGESAQPNFTDPEVIAAIQYYMDLLRDFSPNTELQGYDQNTIMVGDDKLDLISEGRVGMLFDYGFWYFRSSVDNADPNVQLAIAPPPFGDTAIEPQDVNTDGLYISATTEHPEACWAWLKHLSADASALENGFPARTSVAQSTEFAEQAPTGAVEVFAAYSDVLDQSPASNAENETPPDVPIDYFWFFHAIDQAMQGETDLEQGLAEAQRITEEYLACARSGGEDAEMTCPTQVDPDYNGWRQPPEEDGEP